ncbi:MAG TPA: MATE family efflux transporter [Sedimentibacter sp.]|nr:MATE family efflux transporter [Sedimentibacter sp.]HNZ82832.1 MATE family efflux transporter [Sedimentibacter sp.]HOH69595.1 MATE family efflux transporter [Sedimentibacter sp.]HQB63100.1 MATE family efflux transporter [Sedimentibacter sp.]
MINNVNLTEGKIRSALVRLALPIMGTSFIQMAYNLTDIMWLGRLSTNAVAAAGAAGFFLWVGSALVMIAQVGVGVKVAHSYGKGDLEAAKTYINNGLQLNISIALLYSLFLYLFRHEIIGFFNIEDSSVVKMALEYLTIISIGMTFHFLNPVFSAILNSTGNSITPFKTNTIGLIANIIIDPLLIFGFGPFPALGIKGAALATIMSQFFVTIIFLIIGKKYDTIYSHVKLFNQPNLQIIKDIVKIGFPPFVQVGIHAGISIVLTRILAVFGPVAIAVQSIGSQIESITWMTTEGFSQAISAFTGQNYGAGKIKRIKEGYVKGIQIIGGIGVFATLLLIFGAELLFEIFTPNDPTAIKEGIIYLRILGLSQFLMAIEIGTTGAFNGLGKTIYPTVNGIILNVSRIPAALILSKTALGLSGVWWAITISSNLKGLVLFVLFYFYWKHFEKNHSKNNPL